MQKTTKILLTSFILLLSCSMFLNLISATNYFTVINESQYLYDSTNTYEAVNVEDNDKGLCYANNASLNFVQTNQSLSNMNTTGTINIVENTKYYNQTSNQSIQTRHLEVSNTNLTVNATNRKLLIDEQYTGIYSNEFTDIWDLYSESNSPSNVLFTTKNSHSNVLHFESLDTSQRGFEKTDNNIATKFYSFYVYANNTSDVFTTSFQLWNDTSLVTGIFLQQNYIYYKNQTSYVKINTLIYPNTWMHFLLYYSIDGTLSIRKNDIDLGSYIVPISTISMIKLLCSNKSVSFDAIYSGNSLQNAMSNYYYYQNLKLDMLFSFNSYTDTSFYRIHFVKNNEVVMAMHQFLEILPLPFNNYTKFSVDSSSNAFHAFYYRNNPLQLSLNFDFSNNQLSNSIIEFNATNNTDKIQMYGITNMSYANMYGFDSIIFEFTENMNIFAIDSNIHLIFDKNETRTNNRTYIISNPQITPFFYSELKSDYSNLTCQQLYEINYLNSFSDYKKWEIPIIGPCAYEMITNEYLGGNISEFGYSYNNETYSNIDSNANKVKTGLTTTLTPINDMGGDLYSSAEYSIAEIPYAYNVSNFQLNTIVEFIPDYSIAYYFNDSSILTLQMYLSDNLPLFHIEYWNGIYLESYSLPGVMGVNHINNQVYFSMIVDDNNDDVVCSLMYNQCVRMQNITNLSISSNFTDISVKIHNFLYTNNYTNLGQPTPTGINLIGITFSLPVNVSEFYIFTMSIVFPFGIFNVYLFDYMKLHSDIAIYALSFNTDRVYGDSFALSEPTFSSSDYRVVFAYPQWTSWRFSTIISEYDKTQYLRSCLTIDLTGGNQSYDDLIYNNASDLFLNNRTGIYNITWLATNFIYGMINSSNVDATLFANFTITWIVLVESYQSMFDFATNMFLPILIIFIFPIVFGMKFGKFGFGLGLIFSVLIWSLTGYLTIFQSILLGLLAFGILAVILMKYKKEKEAFT